MKEEEKQKVVVRESGERWRAMCQEGGRAEGEHGTNVRCITEGLTYQ